MSKRVVLYPYQIHSASAKAIQDSLQEQGVRCIRVYPDGRYRPRPNDLIINWGNSGDPIWINHLAVMVNPLTSVLCASNKLTTFKILKNADVSIPEYTTEPEVARRWCFEEKKTIVCRHVLNGSQGEGIKIYEGTGEGYTGLINEPRRPPLYVQYIKKKAEYRVHIWKGEIIDVQQKRKMRDFPGDIDTMVRSHSRGWVFCRDNVNLPDSCRDHSKRAVQALGLDFGAVDIIWNDHYQKAYVLEVNTAPGLEGQTLTNYVNKIKELL